MYYDGAKKPIPKLQGADKVQDKTLPRTEFYEIRTTSRRSVDRLDYAAPNVCVTAGGGSYTKSVFSAAEPEAPETP